MWKLTATIAALAFFSGMAFGQSGTSSVNPSTIPPWFTDLLLAVVGSAVVWILTQIRQSILALNTELRSTNTNLARLDRRVAFLEGRFFRHVDSSERETKEGVL